MLSVANFRTTQLSVGGASRTSVRYATRMAPRSEKYRYPEGHGSQIWVWSHMMTKQVVYSFTEVLNPVAALRQLPFTGKKCKPTKLRKDYWEPMALIEFPEKAGPAAAQSVMQKLREFRRMHELCWGDEITFRPRATDTNPEDDKKQVRSRWERGRAINDQRANSIADMAAVLAGKGRGNRLLVAQQELDALMEEGKELTGWKWFWRDNYKRRMRLKQNPPAPELLDGPKSVETQGEGGAEQVSAEGEAGEVKAVEGSPSPKDVDAHEATEASPPSKPFDGSEFVKTQGEGDAEQLSAEGEAGEVKAVKASPKPSNYPAYKTINLFPPRDKLLPVTVYWAVDLDRNYAQSWSNNVTHELMENALRLSTQYEDAPVVDAPSYGVDNLNYKLAEPAGKASKLEA